MRKLILTIALALTLAMPAYAHHTDEDEDGDGYDQPQSYTTVPFGNPYSGQQGTGFTTYDRSYTHACTTMRLGLGWTTVCR